MVFLRIVAVCLLAACGGAAVKQDPHVQLKELWAKCPSPAGDAPVQTCTYGGAVHEIPRQRVADIVDVDADNIPASDTAFERTAPYIVVRGLDPTDRVTVGGLGPGRAGVGDAALVILGLATRGMPTAETDLPAARTPTAKEGKEALPYAARTELLAMAPGLTGVVLIHHKGKDHILRIFSAKRTDLVIGGSASLDFNVLPNRPFGTVELGPRPSPTSPRVLHFAQDPIFAATVHALIGMRIRDTALWVGTPVFSTSGDMFSGVELHAGQRRPSFSQALYFGVYGALRWISRQRTDGFTGDDDINHLPRDWQLTATFGLELQFDALTFATGHDGLATAFSSK